MRVDRIVSRSMYPVSLLRAGSLILPTLHPCDVQSDRQLTGPATSHYFSRKGPERNRSPSVAPQRSQHFVDSHLRDLIAVLGSSEIIALQVGYQNSCLGAESSGNFGEQNVVIGILLFEHIDELISREVDDAFG